MCGIAARLVFHTPVRLTAIVRSQFSSEHSAIGVDVPSIPALLNA